MHPLATLLHIHYLVNKTRWSLPSVLNMPIALAYSFDLVLSTSFLSHINYVSLPSFSVSLLLWWSNTVVLLPVPRVLITSIDWSLQSFHCFHNRSFFFSLEESSRIALESRHFPCIDRVALLFVQLISNLTIQYEIDGRGRVRGVESPRFPSQQLRTDEWTSGTVCIQR